MNQVAKAMLAEVEQVQPIRQHVVQELPGAAATLLGAVRLFVSPDAAMQASGLASGSALRSQIENRHTAEEEKPMAHANEDVVRQAYMAFGEGDMDTLRSLFAPDAVHVATGNNPLSREYKGVDDILGYYGKLFERSGGTFRAELQSVRVEGDDTVVTTHHDSGERNGKMLDQDENLTFTISGGKFTRIVEDHSDPAAYDDFWS